ncbi:MAG: ATP-binding cassette domain-containing protein [Thermoplasmata archaeon]|nr:ATP-binding cassette domain-containing protein [Thermoplasmata archaeon]MCJ7561660.1 ATP-binding cassette domain-containing protein [Thermoplasmata archaeon]TFG70190.1 MAG: ATP-binding cassette domain-containing protein [Methanomassiliicoccus sp.]
MTDNIIEVENLEHSFGDLKAVDKVSFSVQEGEIFSFLGPNGAGKSTTINVLTTQLPCQKGTVRVCGFDVRTAPHSVKESIGIVFQDEVLDRDMTVKETLEFHGRIYSMPRAQRLEREKELLELVELEEKVDVRTKHLSGGMKRRLEIARGLMTRPRVLFLDEPTIGLDPQTRLRIWDYIKRVNEEGTTIFLTTHYMDEADLLSNRIEIMDHGKIIASGTSESLKNTLGKDMIYLETENDEKSAEISRRVSEVTEVKKTSKGLELILDADGSRVLPTILRSIEDESIDILSVKMKKPSLDDVFVHYTGREIRTGPGENGMPKMRRR